jgi:hypothetical protein
VITLEADRRGGQRVIFLNRPHMDESEARPSRRFARRD